MCALPSLTWSWSWQDVGGHHTRTESHILPLWRMIRRWAGFYFLPPQQWPRCSWPHWGSRRGSLATLYCHFGPSAYRHKCRWSLEEEKQSILNLWQHMFLLVWPVQTSHGGKHRYIHFSLHSQQFLVIYEVNSGDVASLPLMDCAKLLIYINLGINRKVSMSDTRQMQLLINGIYTVVPKSVRKSA